MPDQADIALRLVVATLLGSIIGLERELTGQVAGLRTHLTVALGAVLFGLVSAYGFQEFIAARETTNYQVDPTRVASNIVTGVGFLGGGAIIKHGATVRGLTTAASMWVTAAIGLAVGLGGYFEALLTTALLLFALTALRGPRRWLRQRFAVSKDTVVIQVERAEDVSDVMDALYELPGIEVGSVSVRRHDGRATIEADLKGKDLATRLADLAEQSGVGDVDVHA
jgi:putative Mg2+ transporter-C (MgtC) family protein